MGGGGGGGGGGLSHCPTPKCGLTQMMRMHVLHTGSHIHQWEPLHKTLLDLRAVMWVSSSVSFTVPGLILQLLEGPSL